MLSSTVSPPAGQAALEGGRTGCRGECPSHTEGQGLGWEPAGTETHRARRRPPVAQQGRGWAVDCLGPSLPPNPQPGSPAPPGNPLETRGAGQSGEPWEGQWQVGSEQSGWGGQTKVSQCQHQEGFLV